MKIKVKFITRIPVEIVPSEYEVVEWYHAGTTDIFTDTSLHLFQPTIWEKL